MYFPNTYDTLCGLPEGSVIIYEGEMWRHYTMIRDEETVHYYENRKGESLCPSYFEGQHWTLLRPANPEG